MGVDLGSTYGTANSSGVWDNPSPHTWVTSGADMLGERVTLRPAPFTPAPLRELPLGHRTAEGLARHLSPSDK